MSRTTARPSTALRATSLLLITLLIGLFTGAGAGVASADPATGWLRVAHLSPDTADVDVYLTPFSGGGRIVLRGVGFGDVSTYRKVPVGAYTASMWPAGAATKGTPVLTGKATVTAGHAYTIAAIGRSADITAEVLTDDLTQPSAGSGRVRVIAAATQAPKVTIAATGGLTLATMTSFGAATAYRSVAAKPWTLTVTPTGGSAKTLTSTVDIAAGVVTTVFVLDATNGALQVRTIIDSKGASTTPTGGVDTGYGPVDHSHSMFGTYWLIGLAACLMIAAAERSRRLTYRPRHART